MAKKDQGQFPLVNGGVVTCTIANGATASDLFDCGNYQVGAIIVPSAFTAATLTFKSSFDGTLNAPKNIKSMDGSGNAYSVAAAANDHIPLDPSIFAYVPYLQIISSVAQEQAVQIQLILAPLWSA